MKRLLLSGFEPFGDFAANPSWDALKLALDLGLLPADTHVICLPVDYRRTFDAYVTAVEAVRPDAAISFGLHFRKGSDPAFGNAESTSDPLSVIYIETTARNRDGATKPDNAGQRASGPIAKAGPAMLTATFPANTLLEALKRAGFSADFSEDAGTYLCNHLFYRTLHAFTGRFAYGFVHVPPVDTLGGVLSLQELARAIAIMANTLDSGE